MNLGTIGYAISVGWMGIQLMKYDSDESPLPSGRVSKGELGWIASILGLGGLAGTIASGCMADRFGRKYTLLAMAIPEIVSHIFMLQKPLGNKSPKLRERNNQSNRNWCCLPQQVSYVLIILAQNPYYLYASRFFSGFVGGAMFVVVPLMVAEIAEDR